jgi:bacillithiol biosynthesis cysteine-adding enzyme BshC
VAVSSVDLRRFPGIRRLAADYAYDFPRVATFFAGDPRDAAAWRSAISRAQAHGRRRRELVRVLRAQQERRGAPTAAAEAADRLGDPRTVAIVTGQQAGLFGGPLFTLLKAVTALKLAERTAQDHGVPVTAVFWIDAEDHDWDEVRSCTVFDETLATRTISLSRPDGPPGVPIGAVRLDASIERALAELEQALPATEFRTALLEKLSAAYAPGSSMSEAFGRWLEQVLGPRGLVVYDASDPDAKPLAGSLFARELSAPGAAAQLAAQAGAELEARGYHAQVQPDRAAVSLFRLGDDGVRHAVRTGDREFRAGDERFPADVLLREIYDQPARFSPNVLLRPLVQDALFPTVCYVPGPNELAYLAQLGAVYARFEIPMPLLYPRCSATLLDAAAARFLAKHGLPLDALQPQDEAALNTLLEREIPPEVETSFGAATSAVETNMARLIEAMPGVDPTLENAARSTLKRMQHDLETLHGKVLHAVKRRHETLRRQFLRTRALTFPDGHPQERTIGFVYFLNLHGPTLVDRIKDELPLDLRQHFMLTM